MEFHFFLTGLIAVTGLYYGLEKNKKNSNIYTYVILIFLFLFAGFRDITVGNDTYEYVRQFNSLSGISGILNNIEISRYEIGYVALCTIIKTFTNNYTVLLSIVSAFYLISVGRFINKYSQNKWLSIMVFYLIGNYFLIFNIIRQCIVICILLNSIDYIISNKKKKYIISMLVATTFHISSVVLIPLVFIREYKLNIKQHIRILIITIALILVFDKLMLLIVNILPQYKSYYMESIYSEGGVRLASIVNIIVIGIIMLICKIFSGKKYKNLNNSERNNIENVYMNLFELMTIINVVILILSLQFNLLDRISEYFTSILIVYLPNSISRLGKYTYLIGYIVICLLVIYITVILYARPEWSGILPYKFK